MGYIREHRTAKLLEDTLLEWLNEGYIPTTGELREALVIAEQKHGDLTRSGLRQVVLPKRYSQSSASQHNKVLDAISGDLDVLLRSLIDTTNFSMSILSEWNSRAKSLDIRLSQLKSRIESLLLLKSDTAGYVSFVEDTFLSLENVSSETTANIDTRVGDVTLYADRSEGSGNFQSTQIDLSKNSEVSFTFIENSNIRYRANPSGSSLENMTSDTSSRWGSEVETLRPDRFKTSSKSGKPIMGEFKIKLEEDTEISRIFLENSDAGAGANTVVAAQYSTDGYAWENVPSESPVQSGTGSFSWRFKKTLMRWIKIIVSKSSPDVCETARTIYDFGFSKIAIYKEIFEVEENGLQLVSELMTPKLGGANVTFGRTSLEVCEEVPSDTSLRYYLRAYDGNEYTDWVQVSPLSREIENIPAVVDFSVPTKLSSESLTTSFNSAINVEGLNIMRVDNGSDLLYRFDGPDDTIANFYIPQSDNFLTDLVLVRNLGYLDAKYPSLITGDLLIGDIPCGWGLDNDSIYYCVFLINNPNGLEINFGSSQAVLDRSVVSGIVTIKPGWHTFRTDRANWVSLQNNTVPTNEVELNRIDPLYPYNHKYLIEGYNYPDNWTGGNKVYLGTDEYGQYLATRIGRHNFINSELDFSIYALDVISGPKTIILLKFDSSRPNHENERVRLFYTRRYDSFQGIQFKAVLQTFSSEKTPILSYYRVRVK